MFNTNAQCLADVSFHIVAYMYSQFRYSGKNPMRFAVFWRISVRFCSFQTPLTPPSKRAIAFAHFVWNQVWFNGGNYRSV